MKAKLCLLVAIFLAGCGLFSGPTSTVKKYMASAEKGDVETMNSLFSANAIKQEGLEKIRSNNQNFSDIVRAAFARGEKPQMNNIRESKTFAGTRVSFVYEDRERNDSIDLGFSLTKEKGDWKIEFISGRQPTQLVEPGPPSPGESPALKALVAPPPPPVSETGTPSSLLAPSLPTSNAPISGGVLNAKAVSLPQPPYPPSARSVKASGTVVVGVLVDENGNVISAYAVSGNPLLQAVSVAAARSVKFSPTKLSGQPVKVKGVIIYKFDAPQ
jgi:TonB family protein